MKIYLIRHAQTTTNLKGINFDDKKNVLLTKRGQKQARELAQKLIKIKIDKIFISEAKRSYQTILPLIKLKSIPFKIDTRLNEANFGIFSGLTFKAAEKKYPEIYNARLKDKWNYRIPKGESFKDVSERLESFLKNLKKESNKVGSVLTITHATVLKVFLVKFLKFPLKKADSTYFKNTSISFFEIKNKNIKAKTINDSTHLDNDTLKSKRIYRR
ncbi:MAG: hypothetical protein COY73_00145 [Candidatus Nealsonbacteria bacterium CG_4_10_14_0_8_um_filter_37_14]|uniref:Histidine phosphatase family protein n=1 Tax=Candidatus Nealsonbacteria bacterium CG_4_10_14_0_8_um_filter_37_14 TaxID=1974684 RepID=A0A2M7R7W2_9BACT|nr:MAG: hypothetical protein COV63_00800 [Candidatus Nealsonbacteria bacterium CG11_big_fil_rev_8_21_14_0_20_37_68]PIY89698.1 MAG: hypothetical protein COY73_00145 [Candidatus Nealsonbacteria bacterium CG_4_10_14_0_8_um_filter_37_14]